MIIRTLYIPERSDAIALKIAYAVQAGTIPCLEQYHDEDRAAASAQVLATLHGDPAFRVRCVVLEQRATDDGRIPVARTENLSSASQWENRHELGGHYATPGHCQVIARD